ncbi:hypothetical protein [Dongia sp.]|uniref:hypothetical protein n=1 Tax=Dongia sp. TaxID=1977262 RepID=UPI0035AF37E8
MTSQILDPTEPIPVIDRRRIAIINALLAILTCFAGALPAKADIAVTREDCARLVKYRQAPGVEYQPGIDVRGNPVAPADLGGGYQIKPPETIIIPIEILIQDRFHIPANSALWNAKAQVGVVTVKGDQVFYEGQLLGDAEAAALEEVCRERAGQP